jgi:hypothetical protein
MAGSSVSAQQVRSGAELLAAAERSFSSVPFGAPEGTSGLTPIRRDECEPWGDCGYRDEDLVGHFFFDGELVVKAVDLGEVGDRSIEALGIGTARLLDEVIDRVRNFLPEARVGCETSSDGDHYCHATLGEGWITLVFDGSGHLTDVRIDAYHFT